MGLHSHDLIIDRKTTVYKALDSGYTTVYNNGMEKDTKELRKARATLTEWLSDAEKDENEAAVQAFTIAIELIDGRLS